MASDMVRDKSCEQRACRGATTPFVPESDSDLRDTVSVYRCGEFPEAYGNFALKRRCDAEAKSNREGPSGETRLSDDCEWDDAS